MAVNNFLQNETATKSTIGLDPLIQTKSAPSANALYHKDSIAPATIPDPKLVVGTPTDFVTIDAAQAMMADKYEEIVSKDDDLRAEVEAIAAKEAAKSQHIEKLIESHHRATNAIHGG